MLVVTVVFRKGALIRLLLALTDDMLCHSTFLLLRQPKLTIPTKFDRGCRSGKACLGRRMRAEPAQCCTDNDVCLGVLVHIPLSCSETSDQMVVVREAME